VHEEFFIQTSYFDVEENAQSSGFVITPNPSDGNVTLHFGGLKGVVEVGVCDCQGKKVDDFSIDTNLSEETTYTMWKLKNGLYFFVMNCNGTTLTQKVMLLK